MLFPFYVLVWCLDTLFQFISLFFNYLLFSFCPSSVFTNPLIHPVHLACNIILTTMVEQQECVYVHYISHEKHNIATTQVVGE